MDGEIENVIIIGRGAAAHTAAIYAARASLNPLVLGDGEATYVEIDADRGSPGFPQRLDENDLLAAMQAQSKRFGTRYDAAASVRIVSTERPFAVESAGKRYRAHSLICAEGTGSLKAGSTELSSRHDKGAASSIPGIFLCPQAMKKDASVHMIVAAAEGCQASMETERSLQERNITAPDQRTEQWS